MPEHPAWRIMTEVADESSRDGLTGETPVRTIRRDGKVEKTGQELLHEQVLQVFVNGKLTMRLVCTREYLPELVMGRLLTEKMILCAEDVRSVTVCRFGRNALVTLREREGDALPASDSGDGGQVQKSPEGASEEPGNKDGRRQENSAAVETVASCCTGNQILDRSLALDPELRPAAGREVRKEWIFRLADAFAREQPLYAATRSIHSCILSRCGRILFSCEDIGRHNALDKAIGYALLHEIPLPECEVYTSGRIPLDMTEKVIRAGIPVLVSKAAPTVEAVELARSCGIMVIGQARPDSFRLYCGECSLV